MLGHRRTRHAHAPAAAETADSRSPRWLLFLLAVAQLIVILDISAVNVALPDLARDLDIGRANLSWTITSYSLIFGSLLLLAAARPICSDAGAFS